MFVALDDRELAIRFHPGDEPDATLVEVVEPRVVDIGFVKDYGRARLKADVLACCAQVMVLAVGDDRELWQVTGDIDRGMQFYRAFCLAKNGPRRERQA